MLLSFILFFYCLCCCLDIVILKIVVFIISLWFIFCVFLLRSVVDVGDIVLHVVYCYNERTQLLFIIFSVVVVGIWWLFYWCFRSCLRDFLCFLCCRWYAWLLFLKLIMMSPVSSCCSSLCCLMIRIVLLLTQIKLLPFWWWCRCCW